jgi:hypothetical protein
MDFVLLQDLHLVAPSMKIRNQVADYTPTRSVQREVDKS